MDEDEQSLATKRSSPRNQIVPIEIQKQSSFKQFQYIAEKAAKK